MARVREGLDGICLAVLVLFHLKRDRILFSGYLLLGIVVLSPLLLLSDRNDQIIERYNLLPVGGLDFYH